jgi:hypothetical protein
MPAGFITKNIKDGDGNLFSTTLYADATGNVFAAPVITDGAGNKMPAMDAATRPGYMTPVVAGAVVAAANPLPISAIPAGSNLIGKTQEVDSAGNVIGSKSTYILQTTFVALAQNKLFFDLFNATGSGKIIRVQYVGLQKDMSAQTGVAVQFNLNFTTTVGTGGSALTAIKLDSGNAALPAQITARSGATAGATLGNLLVSRFYHSEETNIAAQVQEAFSFWPLLTGPHRSAGVQDIVLREGEGLTLKQITNTTAGVYNAVVIFTAE